MPEPPWSASLALQLARGELVDAQGAAEVVLE
jgi:hypothetical protein